MAQQGSDTTGHVLWTSGASCSDISVVLVSEDGSEETLFLHSAVLSASSGFFRALLSAPWTFCGKEEDGSLEKRKVRLDDTHASTMRRALELLYTNHFTQITSAKDAASLLHAFHFLAADTHIDWCARFLATECLKANDSKTLAQSRGHFPHSPFFAETNAVLSANIMPTESNPHKAQTNSMTVEDLGLLIAKSATRDGQHFALFVHTEFQENERLHFAESNGLALIYAFETILADLERKRLDLVEEALDDKDRLETLELESDSSDQDSDNDSDPGWDDEQRVGRPPNLDLAAGPAAAVPVNPNLDPALMNPLGEAVPGAVDLLIENQNNLPGAAARIAPNRRRRRTAPRTRSATRHQNARDLRITKLRHLLARRCAKRDKSLAQLKHDFIMRSTRLFKLLPRVAGLQKIVILDSWVNAGHELFCGAIEPKEEEDEAEAERVDDFDEDAFDTDSESSFDEYDELDEDDDSDADLSDSDAHGDSLDDDINDADSFVLGPDDSDAADLHNRNSTAKKFP
ncbi:hypothetical protein HDU98_008777, partial [Podochytrium sp. JEL0797]